MSIKQYPGGIITKNPTAPTTSSAKGIWTLDQAQNYTKQGIWPRSPGAPTIGTATATSSSTATVAFTAPTDLGTGGVTYTAISSPGGFNNTGTSPITVSGLTASTSYTFTVIATSPGGTGPASAASNSITTSTAAGSQAYTIGARTGCTAYTWVVPAGVTSVSILAIGAGGNGCISSGQAINGGGGGGLSYRNNISVTPGTSYTVNVSNGVCGVRISSLNIKAAGGAGPNPGSASCGLGAVKYSGGQGGYGGGGAAGYAGNGGNAACTGFANGSAGSGGGGGGAARARWPCGGIYYGAGGGGVGATGQGCSGAGGSYVNNDATSSASIGLGGSGGANGTKGTRFCQCGVGVAVGGSGGSYGGGGGTGSNYCFGGTLIPATGSGTGGNGYLRIIWPGNTRTYPSTCVGSP